jgi:hypothetical protein
MIIYSQENMIPERIKEAEKILSKLPFRYCFITGSFLFKEKYKDIDVFAITRSNKEIKGINLNKIDFNDLHSLFYYSISNMCVAKSVLPKKEPRVTIADYWSIINETIPTLINEKESFHKTIRSLILYTEYLKNKKILGSFELNKLVYSFKNYTQVLNYIKEEAPIAIHSQVEQSYIKRYFYSQAGFHKENIKYAGQKDLYDISHAIIAGA